jgi:AcrR family transcriptional regulator
MKTMMSVHDLTPNDDAEDCLTCGKGRPRAADKEARVQNLIATAHGLFMSKGYGKVSLEMIAREAHVAVRTIYVKFGGKAGLFKAVIEDGRARLFNMEGMDASLPTPELLEKFALSFLELISAPEMTRACRMVIAEASTNPELASAFFQAGPGLTREMLNRYFSRPAVRALFRDDMSAPQLSEHLILCLVGDQMVRMLFEPPPPPPQEEQLRRARVALALFYRGTLKSADAAS